MQNQNITMTGSSIPVKATCQSEAFEFYCAAHTFTFQYAIRLDEQPTPQPGEVAKTTVGDASSAEAYAATLFKFIAESAKGKPWNVGDTIGYLNGTNADVVVCRPRRAGGN